ncbi:MAG TPA: hypothetical protein VFO65_11645 [Acidimicrobiales bacterium]|nr:hypothetical protein [Acidimicrobiales bacterium]
MVRRGKRARADPPRAGAAGPDRSAMWQIRGWHPEADEPHANGTAVASPHLGHCRCGAPASGSCGTGCGRPTCGPHLRPGSSLARAGPYRSEREHTAYLHAYAAAAGRCQWCREEAGVAAVAGLAPAAPLPAGAGEALCVLLRHGHDYPAGAWDDTVAAHGGVTALLRRLAPEVVGDSPRQSFEGRRRSAVLCGTALGPPGAQGCLEVLDGSGAVWLVRPEAAGMVARGRRVWTWEPAGAPRQDALLRWVVGRLAAGGD